MKVVKGDGSIEEFRVEKLIHSLVRAGAPEAVAEEVAGKVMVRIKDGMSTNEIYREAFRRLKKVEHISAAKYSMRRAILELGPTGFPFEDFVSSVLRARGFDTEVRAMVPGKCATHEVDIVMEKDGVRAGAELKFHNAPGFKVDMKTALYVWARFSDILAGAAVQQEKSPIQEGWLITNTKFTTNTIDYAKCAGLKLLGWTYPSGESLSDMVDSNSLYPVTVLTSLSSAEKKRLLENGVTLCKMITDNPDHLARAGVARRKHRMAIEESAGLCKP